MTQPIFLSQLSRPMTCEEFDQNTTALLQRANHTGVQLASTISDFETTVDGLPAIIALQLCCNQLTTDIAALRNDIFGSGDLTTLLNALEARVVNKVNSLAAVVNALKGQVTSLNLDIDSLVANIQSLTTSVSSLQSQITAIIATLATKAPISSPAFLGNPTAPTPIPSDNSTSLATTAFVKTAVFPATATSFGVVRTNTTDPTPIVYRKQEIDSLLNTYAPLNSPSFSGSPSISPGYEPVANDNTGRLPTTAWVTDYVASHTPTIAVATSSASGTVKTNSTSSDPTVYLKSEVDTLLGNKAPTANPVFTGSATIPNAAITGTSTIGNVTLQGTADLTTAPGLTDNSTKVPNTSWVVQYVTGVLAPVTSTGEQVETPTLMSRFSSSYSAQRRADIDLVIKRLKQAGIYQLLDRLYVFTAPSTADGLVNWITAYNNPASVAPSDRIYANIGLSENGNLTVPGVDTFTNMKPGNLSILMDTWTSTRTTGGGGISILRSSDSTTFTANATPHYGDLLLVYAGTSGFYKSTQVQAVVEGDVGFSEFPCSFGFSYKGDAMYGYHAGTRTCFGASSPGYGGNPNPIPNPTSFPSGLSAILDSSPYNFTSFLAMGAALTPTQHSVANEVILDYVSSYLAQGYEAYLN